MMNEFREVDEVNVHIQGASVVGYIREVFGIEAIRSNRISSPTMVSGASGMNGYSAVLAFSVSLAGSAFFGSAVAQDPDRLFGASVAIGLAGSPLGEVAGSYGLRAIPGAEYDLRLFTRSVRSNEWSVGVLIDTYSVGHVVGIPAPSEFGYSATSLIVGRYWAQPVRGATLRSGLDLGWRHFQASSTRPDAHTGEVYTSSVRGSAALLGVSYGVELSSRGNTLTPRVRLETSYPDFGGGDGYSGLHRESDLGFKASVGLELRRSFTRS